MRCFWCLEPPTEGNDLYISIVVFGNAIWRLSECSKCIATKYEEAESDIAKKERHDNTLD